MAIIFPQKSEILQLQAELIEKFGGIHGLRDEGGFESALAAAENRFYYETEDLASSPRLTLFIFRRLTLFLTEIKGLRRQSREFFSE